MAETAPPIECALLPVEGDTLLLPALAVLEVLGGERLRAAAAGAPDWLLGTLVWRERTIPVVSFFALAGGEPPAPLRRQRVAVLRLPDAGTQTGWVGLRCRGPAQRLSLVPGMLEAQPLEPGQSLRLARARLGALRCAVPDLDALRERIGAL